MFRLRKHYVYESGVPLIRNNSTSDETASVLTNTRIRMNAFLHTFKKWVGEILLKVTIREKETQISVTNLYWAK